MKVRVGEVFGPLFTVTLSNPAAANGSADPETRRQVAATAGKVTHLIARRNNRNLKYLLRFIDGNERGH